MISLITPGSTWLLDGKTEVTVLKPTTRSNSSYIVEIPGRSIEMVSSDRLTPFVAQTSQGAKVEELFDYDE